MSDSQLIDDGVITDNDLLSMETAINKEDQDLRSVFVQSGLLGFDDEMEEDENQLTGSTDDDGNDYDVADLLKGSITES